VIDSGAKVQDAKETYKTKKEHGEREGGNENCLKGAQDEVEKERRGD